ncbi:MAG: hypothetical protein JWN86_1782 [Planctomycetota bacterium]|nr:hypothetical protein [Planctomycetota bacterium]
MSACLKGCQFGKSDCLGMHQSHLCDKPEYHSLLKSISIPAKTESRTVSYPDKHVVPLLGLYSRFGRRVRYTPKCGVICAGEASVFIGIKLMLTSLLLSHDVPCTVFDLGFTLDQRQWLYDQGLNLVIPDLPEGHRFELAENRWTLWVKPLLMRLSPYETTVWLDADIVVDRDLSELADLAAVDGVVIYTDSFATDPSILLSNPRLYERHPVPEVYPSVNSGVVAYTDRKFLDLACQLFDECKTDKLLASWIACWDQGLIKHALESLGIRPRDDLNWNRPGWTVAERGTPLDSPEVLARCLPGTLTHFQATGKPWEHWHDFPVSLRVPEDLSVYILGHEPFSCPASPFLVPLNLSERQHDQSLGECRVFAQIAPEDVPTPFVGLATHRWVEKYGERRILAPWQFGDLDLRADIVYCAMRTDNYIGLPYPDWTHHCDHYNPGLGKLIEELRSYSGRTESTVSCWSNNFVMHVDVYRDLRAFWLETMAYFVAKYPACPYEAHNPPRSWAYFGEAISVHYLASRPDLRFVEMTATGSSVAPEVSPVSPVVIPSQPERTSCCGSNRPRVNRR